MSRFKRFLRSSRAASAVEFALVAPIFILVLVGIIDFGRIFNAYITITHAAREAAREAAVCEGCTAAQVEQWARDRATGVNIAVSECSDPNTGCSCVLAQTDGTAAFPGERGDYITVTIRQFVAVTTPLMSQFFGHGCAGGPYANIHGVTLTTSSSYYRER